MSATTEAPNPAGKSPRQRRKDRWVLWGILSAVTLPILLFLAAWISLTVYDNNHPVSIECTVTGTEFKTGGAGRSPQTKTVLISTSDCGTLVVSRVNASTSFEAVAAELAPGGRYRFEVGEGSLSLPWIHPRVSFYEKLD